MPREDARWATLLSATYHESRDCPLVDGWRSLNDVLDSYQATGQYLPEGWRIARVGTVDVGCAIVAAHPAHRQWELIYFGVHPAARGFGWGTVILAQILFTARERNVSELVLTVDAANLPALRIYTEAGFQELDRRFVLVRRLQDASAQPPI